METRSPSALRGWTVVLAALSINLILGVLCAWGVMGKALVMQMHRTKAEASLPFTVSTVAFALTMIFAGRCQDRMGPRWVAMLGGIILGIGLTLSSFASLTQGGVLITFGIIGGIGIGLGTGDYAAVDQMVSTGAQGFDYRHRGQRRGPRGSLHVPINRLPDPPDQHPANVRRDGGRNDCDCLAAVAVAEKPSEWIQPGAGRRGDEAIHGRPSAGPRLTGSTCCERANSIGCG